MLEKPEELKSLTPQQRARFLFDQRKKILDSIEYLTFMLKTLPEKQQEKVFTPECLRPFLRALLLSLESDNPDKRRKRILQLWGEILGNVLHKPGYMDKIIHAESKDVRDFIFGGTSEKTELLRAFLWLATTRE